MKKLSCCIIVISSVYLAGCAGPSIKSSDAILIEQSRSAAKTECVRAKSDADVERMKAIGKLPESQQGMAMMADAMARQAEAMVGKDPCSQGMNYFEYAAVEVKEKNETVRSVLPMAFGAASAAYAVDRMAAVATSAVKNGGNHTTTSMQGDGNSAQHTNEQTITNTDITASSSGDSAPVGTGSVSASGTNKPVTTNNGIIPEGMTAAGSNEQ